MSAILRILEQGTARQTVALPAGRELVIGRNPQCDVPVPTDPMLSFRHLVVCYQGGVCRIRDLGSTNGTRLNGLPIGAAEVTAGDVFVCGSTEFRVELPGAAGDGPGSPGSPHAGAVRAGKLDSPELLRARGFPEVWPPHLQRTIGFVEDSADRLLGRFRLRLSIPLTPESGEVTAHFLKRLTSIPAQLELLAYGLPPRIGVWWLLSVATGLVPQTAEEAKLTEMVTDWVARPADQLRRAIWAAGQEESERRPYRWAANAVYFCGDSVAPPHAPLLKPPDRLLGQNLLAGIEIACLLGAPAGISVRRKSAVESGLTAGLEGIPRDVLMQLS